MFVGISFNKDFIIIIIIIIIDRLFSLPSLSLSLPWSFSRFSSVLVSHTLRNTNENKENCLVRRLTVSSRVPSRKRLRRIAWWAKRTSAWEAAKPFTFFPRPILSLVYLIGYPSPVCSFFGRRVASQWMECLQQVNMWRDIKKKWRRQKRRKKWLIVKLWRKR